MNNCKEFNPFFCCRKNTLFNQLPLSQMRIWHDINSTRFFLPPNKLHRHLIQLSTRKCFDLELKGGGRERERDREIERESHYKIFISPLSPFFPDPLKYKDEELTHFKSLSSHVKPLHLVYIQCRL